jgi:hypothetical protein
MQCLLHQLSLLCLFLAVLLSTATSPGSFRHHRLPAPNGISPIQDFPARIDHQQRCCGVPKLSVRIFKAAPWLDVAMLLFLRHQWRLRWHWLNRLLYIQC